MSTMFETIWEEKHKDCPCYDEGHCISQGFKQTYEEGSYEYIFENCLMTTCSIIFWLKHLKITM